MAASFTIAARNNGFGKADAHAVTLASVRAYREAMASFAQMGTMDIWYAHLDEDELMASIRSAVAGTATQEKKKPGRKRTDRRAKAPKKKEKRAANREKADRHEEKAEERAEKRAEKIAAKAHTRDSLQALSKLGELVDGKYRIVSQPPIVVPARELAATSGLSPDEVDHMIREQFRAYRATLQDDRRRLLERFEIVDMARKVVGVGSVGTRAFIVLLQGATRATRSSCRSRRPQPRCWRTAAQEPVPGSTASGWCKQRMMQAASDIYLGWTKQVKRTAGASCATATGPVDVELMAPVGLMFYARTCGWALARAHARSGDPVAIAEYLGVSDTLDKSVSDFSERYADQNEQDYEQFVNAVRSGRLEAVEGV
jgi:hypothetical protein